MKRPMFIIPLVTILFALLGASCGAAAQELPGFGGGGAPAEPAFYDAAAPLAVEETYKAANVQTQERLVIKNADLAIVVADPKARMDEIAKLAESMGGFVVSSNLYQTYYGPNSIEVPEATITIRVPSEKLNEALDAIKEGAVDVDYENITGQDVTSVYVDLQSQLKARQAAEKKLLEILDAADETEDVLAVYQQLQYIQSEIEVLKGQIQYYDESVALSAVSVRLIAEETVQPVEIGGWKLQGTANDAIQDLIYFTQGFTQFLIRFVLFNLPALVLIAIPFYLAFLGGRKLFRRFTKKSAVVEVKMEEKK